MGAVRFLLGSRAVIKFVLGAASTLENTDGEKRALRKFPRWNLDLSLLLKRKVLRQVTWQTPFNESQRLTDNYALLDVKLRQVASCELPCSTLGGRSRRSKA